MRFTRLCQSLVAATLILGLSRTSRAEFFETVERDIEILITCLIREFQAGGDWKACIDPDLARVRMTLVISDDLDANPPQDFSYVDTDNDAFEVVKSNNGIAGIPTADGNGATGIETLFVEQGLPPRGANIAFAKFRTSVPLPPNITQLPTSRVTVTEEYKILLDGYASAVRDVGTTRTGTDRSPIGLYRFNVGIDEVVRNVGTGGVGFDGIFSLDDLAGAQVRGPDISNDVDLLGFEDGNLALDIGTANAFVRIPHPNVEAFDPFTIRDFTLSGWINPLNNSVPQNVALFSDGDGSRSLALDFEPGLALLRITDAAIGADLIVEANLDEDQWSHVAAVLDDESDEVQLYINGQRAAPPVILSDFGLDDFQIDLSNFSIGSPTALAAPLYVDELAFWDVALNDEAIQFQYAAALRREELRGDYNGDGVVNAIDIDLQSSAMKRPTPDVISVFDENGDGTVDFVDREILVHEYLRTWFGDSNLDGVFNSSDLIEVFEPGKYDTGKMATWAEGDWNGDMVFDSSDLIVAFIDGGYELGRRRVADGVPEPSTWVLLVTAATALIPRRKKPRSNAKAPSSSS